MIFMDRRFRQGSSGGPVSIGKSLDRLIEALGIGTQILERQAILLWDEVVGSRIAQATKPERVLRGNLYVRVRTATWRHTLMFHRDEIRHKLNHRLGRELIRQILLK